jgi:hypothetical protein
MGDCVHSTEGRFKCASIMGAAEGCGSALQVECLEGFDTPGLHQFSETETYFGAAVAGMRPVCSRISG